MAYSEYFELSREKYLETKQNPEDSDSGEKKIKNKRKHKKTGKSDEKSESECSAAEKVKKMNGLLNKKESPRKKTKKTVGDEENNK